MSKELNTGTVAIMLWADAKPEPVLIVGKDYGRTTNFISLRALEGKKAIKIQCENDSALRPTRLTIDRWYQYGAEARRRITAYIAKVAK